MKAKITFGGEIDNVDSLDGVALPDKRQMSSLEANELFKEYRKPKKFLKIKVFNPNSIWSIDLIDMPMKRLNNNYKFVLNIIDLWSKFVWSVPLKNKDAISVKNAFENLFESNPDHIPDKLYADRGKEWYNKIFKKFLEDNDVEIYSTFNSPDDRSNYGSHNPPIERFNRTIKNWLWKEFMIQGNQKWVDVLPKLIDRYNNKVHRTIGVAPIDALKNPEIIREKINEINYENSNMVEKPKFKVLDRVRIFKWKNKFEKGITHKWSKEIFIIKKVNPTKPITYSLIDLDGEDIEGKFYTLELQKTAF